MISRLLKCLDKFSTDLLNWDTLYKRTSHKEKPDVRTVFIQFLLSFLMDSDPQVIRDYLNTKTRLVNLFR